MMFYFISDILSFVMHAHYVLHRVYPPDTATGSDEVSKADATALAESTSAREELEADRHHKRLRRSKECELQPADSQATLILGDEVPGTPSYEPPDDPAGKPVLAAPASKGNGDQAEVEQKKKAKKDKFREKREKKAQEKAAQNAKDAEKGNRGDEAKANEKSKAKHADLATSEDDGEGSDFCPPRLINFDEADGDMEIESDAPEDLQVIAADLLQPDGMEDTLDYKTPCDKDEKAQEPTQEMEIPKVNEGNVKQKLLEELKEREAREEKESKKEAMLKEHLAKEAEAAKMETKKEPKKQKEVKAKEIKAKDDVELGQSDEKTKDKDDKRPVATPQVAPTRPALHRGVSTYAAVADVLNRTNTKDLTSPPASVSKSQDEPQSANQEESMESDEEIPNPHQDLQDVPTETNLAMVPTKPRRKRSKEQLVIHKKKQSFYRTLASTGP
jgi:hypothetical protein